jgi:hypothetical protein
MKMIVNFITHGTVKQGAILMAIGVGLFLASQWAEGLPANRDLAQIGSILAAGVATWQLFRRDRK